MRRGPRAKCKIDERRGVQRGSEKEERGTNRSVALAAVHRNLMHKTSTPRRGAASARTSGD